MRGVGVEEYRALLRLMEQAERMGFDFDQSPFANDNRFVLTPKDDYWPTYTRDARIYFGDMDETAAFLSGIKMAREYYMVHLRLFTDKRLEKKEQDVRNQYLIDVLKKDPNETNEEDDVPF